MNNNWELIEAMKIHWDQKYLVGHNRIDNEHKIFVDLIKAVDQASCNNASDKKILRLLNEVVLYAKFHFYSEESLMLDTDFPDYSSHKNEHEQLLCQLEDLIHSFKLGSKRIGDLVDFLFIWFALHTTQVDVRLAKHLNNRNAFKTRNN